MGRTRRARHSTKLTPRQAQLVRQIQRLHLRGEPLNITAVKRQHPKLMERVYAVQPYWGTGAAVSMQMKKLRITMLEDQALQKRVGGIERRLRKRQRANG